MKRQEYGRNVFGIRKYSKLQTGMYIPHRPRNFFMEKQYNVDIYFSKTLSKTKKQEKL